MKKFTLVLLLLALALPVSMAACAETTAPDADRFEEMVSANNIADVLSRHSSESLYRTVQFNDEAIATELFYTNADICYIEISDGYAMMMRSDLYVMTEGEGYDTALYCLCDDPQAYRDFFAGEQAEYTLTVPEEEVLSDTVERDGHFFATTMTWDDALVKDTVDSFYSLFGGYEYQEGMGIKYVYDFDAATLDQLSAVSYIVDGDGAEHLLVKDEYAYDEVIDPTANEDGPLYAWLNAGEDTRTIKVTFASDSDAAYSREYTLPKRAHFEVYNNGACVEDYYADAACTQPYEDSDGIQDVEVYVK